MLYIPPSPDPQQNLLRHRCRNPRCRGELKEPTTNPRDAFCCRRCSDTFYRVHCRVCEEPFARTTGNKILCGRPTCRAEFRASPARFSGGRYPDIKKASEINAKIGPQSRPSIAVFTGGRRPDSVSGQPPPPA